MPSDTPIDSTGLEAAVAKFCGAASASLDGMLALQWRMEDWHELFRYTTLRKVKPGEPLIRSGDPDRTLYFVLRGRLEVIVHSGHGISMGAVNKVGVGAVLGEASFFDGKPRSASVWPIDECEVANMTIEQYGEFEKSHPKLARDLLFAMGRVLASRLRGATSRVATAYC